MRLRASPIVTAIVTVIVTTAASFVTPAAAQVLTICASSAHSSALPDRFSSRRFADAIVPLSGRANSHDDALIALWQDEGGFDILVNWGESDQRSLRESGAQIIGMAPSAEMVHLMVAHNDGGLEHLLFSLDEDGSGEVLRSLAGEIADAAAVSSKGVCKKPH